MRLLRDLFVRLLPAMFHAQQVVESPSGGSPVFPAVPYSGSHQSMDMGSIMNARRRSRRGKIVRRYR